MASIVDSVVSKRYCTILFPKQLFLHIIFDDTGTEEEPMFGNIFKSSLVVVFQNSPGAHKCLNYLLLILNSAITYNKICQRDTDKNPWEQYTVYFHVIIPYLFLPFSTFHDLLVCHYGQATFW